MKEGIPTTEELTRRLERARRAQREAEAIAEKATGDLYSAMQELKTLNQSLREFVAIASHDIRSPLTNVLGFATTLNRSWDVIDDEKKKEFIQIIERSARQVSHLCETMLTLSRIESGALETHAEVVDLVRLTKDSIQQFHDRAADIRLEIAGDLQIVADPEHIQRILANYLTNAFKYGEPPVEVSAQCIGDFVVIGVCDNGSGVPEEFVPHLFGKFTRAGTDHEKAGAGLGLSIVRGLAQANGGEAWYEPHNPHGSCFLVKVPRVA